MRSKPILVLAVVLLQVYFASVSSATEPSFQGLGDLSGGSFFSMANGLSADGSTVVGWSISASGPEAFRWTVQGGMQSLGYLPGRDYMSTAKGVSADGSRITGYSSSTLNDHEPFLWIQSEGMQSLGFVSGANSGTAQAISTNGSTIVGNTNVSSYGDSAFRWTSTGGMELLAGFDLSESHYAYEVSGDGSVVVGEINGQAYRWTDPGNMQLLGDLPGGDFYSTAWDVSADGTVVVGEGCVNLIPVGSDSWTPELEAFLWTQSGGMISLGDLPGGTRYSRAQAISANGSVVVGFGRTDDHDKEAFIWDEENGMLNLQELLENSYGLNLSGWTLNQAMGISNDGSVIMGHGENPLGNTEAWIATIPEPGTVLLLGLGAVFLRRKR